MMRYLSDRTTRSIINHKILEQVGGLIKESGNKSEHCVVLHDDDTIQET